MTLLDLTRRLRRFLQRPPDQGRGGEAEQLFPEMSGLAGRCNICGQATTFYYDDWRNARESLICAYCRSTSRYRSIARGLLRAIAERTGVQAPSLAELHGRSAPARLAVYDTQVTLTAARGAYPLPATLAGVPWIDLQTSVYKASLAWGSPVAEASAEGVTNQNLEALTFPDAAFDVVVTSDVMEHVRLAATAHREIRRVLRPGGIYLFTVPHDRGRATTLERVRIVDPSDPARDELLLEPEYHGDANSPDNRALAYRLYGRDLDDELRQLGFDVDYTREDDPGRGIVNTELFYCRIVGERGC